MRPRYREPGPTCSFWCATLACPRSEPERPLTVVAAAALAACDGCAAAVLALAAVVVVAAHTALVLADPLYPCPLHLVRVAGSTVYRQPGLVVPRRQAGPVVTRRLSG